MDYLLKEEEMRKEDNKIFINIKEITDYCYCPMLYKYKYIDKLEKKYTTVLDQYDDCMHKCIYNFFTQATFNNVSISSLKTSFSSYWIKSKSLTSIIYSEPTSWRDTHNEKRKDGIEAIVKFYNHFKDNIGIPLIINKPYKVNITPNLYLEGSFKIVREITTKDNKKEIEILNILSTVKAQNDMILKKDITTTAISYAFRKLFGIEEDNIKFFNINKGKLYTTTRNNEDYNMLIDTVIKVYKCINNNIFYICPTSKCLNCAYKSLCIK